MRWAFAIAVAAMLAGCAQVAPTETSDIVYVAKVWTGDAALPWADAFAVQDGRFATVGTEAEVRQAHPGATVVDLGGQLVLPGLHDTHNHLVRTMLSAEAVQGDPFAPWPPGWDPIEGPVGQQETAAGHIVNWLTINAQRVQDGNAPKPPAVAGGDGHAHVHDRDSMTDVGTWGSTSAAGPNLQVAQDALARYGITSTVEAGAPLASLDVLQDLEDQGLLTARYNLYIFPEDLDDALAKGLVTGNGTAHARLLGMKIYSDGWLGPRTAGMREMYEDRPHSGFTFYTQEELDDWVLRAHQGGLKQTGHTIGDRATEAMLSAYERAVAAGCTGHAVCEDPRFTLEHVQLVGPDLLERMVAIDLVPSIQLSFATTDSHYARDALGDRVEDTYIWNTMLEAGLRIGGSSDWPIEVLPPMWGIERMVTRQEVDGSLAQPWMPAQAVTLEQALRMITIDAAYLEHRDHELGSITPGKLADFVVMERDLFTIPASDIAETDVAMTVVGGRTVFG